MELLEEVSQPGCDKLEIFENSARQSHNRCDLLLETILTEAGGWTGQPPRSLSSNKHLYNGVALTQTAQKKKQAAASNAYFSNHRVEMVYGTSPSHFFRPFLDASFHCSPATNGTWSLYCTSKLVLLCKYT